MDIAIAKRPTRGLLLLLVNMVVLLLEVVVLGEDLVRLSLRVASKMGSGVAILLRLLLGRLRICPTLCTQLSMSLNLLLFLLLLLLLLLL